jgi:hypothetical protein
MSSHVIQRFTIFFYNFIGFEEKFNINYKTNRKAIIVDILRVMSYI